MVYIWVFYELFTVSWDLSNRFKARAELLNLCKDLKVKTRSAINVEIAAEFS